LRELAGPDTTPMVDANGADRLGQAQRVGAALGGVALTSAAHRGLVLLNSGVRLAGHRDVEWLQRGLTSSR